MLESVFTYLLVFEDFLWVYVGVPFLMLLGAYLCIRSNFFPIRKFPHIMKRFFSLFQMREKDNGRGVHPLKAFFACIGGCVGVGNVAAVCTAVQLGGPGALLWVWLTGLLGMVLKYAEVYLGLRYRVPNQSGGYNGGPMYFLQKVFPGNWIAPVICLLLCLYGVEIYQFSIVAHSITDNFGIDLPIVSVALLLMVLFAGSGGVRRVGNIASAVIPIFVVLYVGMSCWVMFNNLWVLPAVFEEVIQSAFSGHAAIGGFVGSTLMMTISQGVRRGCYTGDVGVGYASVIHSESSISVPQVQASLAIVDVFFDTFIVCTSSLLLILTTGVWNQSLPAEQMVQAALGQYFPWMHFFMPFFLFLLGYSTINAYFCVGLKCADLLWSKRGRFFYYLYSIVSLLIFPFVGASQAQSVMAVVGGLLLVLNCYGMFRLRNEISYELPDTLTDKGLLDRVPDFRS